MIACHCSPFIPACCGAIRRVFSSKQCPCCLHLVQLTTAQIRPGVAGIQFPKLALLLRYLVFTHRLLKAQSEGSARQAETESSLEVQELLAKLLSEDRDPPPFPPEFDPYLGQVHTFPAPSHLFGIDQQ